MRTAIIGAGPTGLVLGAGLARRGHAVTVIDRDPGPTADGSWARRGVMQFHHAHAFRGQAAEAVRAEVPDGYERWLELGAEPVTMPIPGGAEVIVAMRSRRETFERALRPVVEAQPGVELLQGHVDRVTQSDGRADGVLVDGRRVDADLVIDASGRSGRVTRDLRPAPTVGGSCGIAYVDRVYQLHPGAEPGPMANSIAWQGNYDGYQVIVFLHEQGTFSVLLIRPTADPYLPLLRHESAFDAACRAIPGLAAWTDPERARPISRVYAGGTLKNHYRSQRGHDGSIALPGLIFVGDSVCTTTPNFGRGVALSLMQVQELLRLFDADGRDLVAVTEAFDAWCAGNMLPWVDDHVLMDEAQRQRWEGEGIDLGAPRLPSDLIMEAGRQDPAIEQHIGGYAAMQALPASLDPAEPLARAVYATGWRPPYHPGPSRAELVEIVRAAAPGGREQSTQPTG